MSIGSTLGKVFGGIGQGLSFLGPIGMGIGGALSAVGGIAGAVGARKDREGMAEEEQQKKLQPSTPLQPDDQRPEQKQIDNTQPATPQPPQRNVFTPQGQFSNGGYQLQLQESIIPSIILGNGRNPFGGP